MFEKSMFFLSFLPLWLSIIIIEGVSVWRGTEHWWTELLSTAAIFIVLIICGIYAYRWIRKEDTEEEKQNLGDYIIVRAKEERFAAVEFMMSYVFPLFAFDFTKWDGVLLFLIFFCCFGFLVIRHRIYCTNLVMEKLGYRSFECELKTYNDNDQADESEETDDSVITKWIVSRQWLEGEEGERIQTRRINNDYEYHLGPGAVKKNSKRRRKVRRRTHGKREGL